MCVCVCVCVCVCARTCIHVCMCSARFADLCYLKIALCIRTIGKTRGILEIAQSKSISTYDYARTKIKIVSSLGLRSLLSTRPGLIPSYHRHYTMFFIIIIMFMLLTLHFGVKSYMYNGMGKTNHIFTKSVLIHPLDRIQKNIQDIPMNCTEQSCVTDNQTYPS